MNNFAGSALAFVVAIGLLVTIHELGHYAVMRLCGVRVLRFAFGFGRTLWSRTDRSGTEWAICLWPLGGYVKPLDTRESTGLTAVDRACAFDTQTVWKRIAMVAAGPLANFLLAILLYTIAFLAGVTEWRPFVAEPASETPAAVAGIRAGDLVTRVEGEPVSTWVETQWRILQTLTDQPTVLLAVQATVKGEVLASDPPRGVEIRKAEDVDLGPALLPALGLKLGLPSLPAVVGQVQPDSAAAEAGLQPGDHVLSIDGVPVVQWSSLVTQVRDHPNRPLVLSVDRSGQSVSLLLTPRAVHEQGVDIGRAGVSPQQDPALLARYRIHRDYGLGEAMVAAVDETISKSRFTLVMLGQMLTGRASLDNLSGPLSIASAAGQTARIGWEAYVRFLAIVSLSLGVINLLPLPLLDGGHLMYYSVEILMGKAISLRRQALLQRLGVALLGTLMFVALFNDLQRLFNW